MEMINQCLEASTVHGLSHISTSRRLVRLFWILVVIAGFTLAAVLIYESFESWAESPVKTTIETLPIINLPFPKITVCPPKNTYTDLNLDLMNVGNMTFENDLTNGNSTASQLLEGFVEYFQHKDFKETIYNLSLTKETNKYRNWYKGTSLIPILITSLGSFISPNKIETYATSGIVISPYFGDKFDINSFELKTSSVIEIKNPYYDAFDDDGHYGNLTLKFKYDIEDEMEWIKVNNVQEFLNPKEHEYELTIPNLESVKVIFNRHFDFWTDLKTKRFTGFRLEWVYNNKGLNETIHRYYKTASLGHKNVYILYIVLANLVHSLEQSSYEDLWRVVKQVKADWVDVIAKPDNNGYGGYWDGGDALEMFQDIFKEIKEKGNFKKKLIPRTPMYEKEITNFTLETAAKMFLYIMTEQKDKDWLDWKEEYSEWLTTSSLRRLQGNIADLFFFLLSKIPQYMLQLL